MIIQGNTIARFMKEALKQQVKSSMRLDIVYIGRNKAIEQYVRAKKKFGEDIGVTVVLHQFPHKTTEEIVSLIKNISKDSSGIIIQLPLPDSVNKREVLDSVPNLLDIDVLSTSSQENFKHGFSKRLPPVVGACAAIVEYHQIDLSDKNIVVLGKGALVGNPISFWLTNKGLSFKHLSKESFDLGILKEADVIFSGIGVPHFITEDMVKSGVIVFDAGTSEDKETVLGDVSPLVSEKALLFTPVPGGIGPLTVSSLFKNMFQ